MKLAWTFRLLVVAIFPGMLLGLMTSGCGDEGVEFNGVGIVDQGLQPRSEPVDHLPLPSEFQDLDNSWHVDVDAFNSINLTYDTFQEPSPPEGYDLWLVSMYPGLPGVGWGSATDNPSVPVPDWIYTLELYPEGPGGASWPDASVSSSGTPAHEFIAAWMLSMQNQWFLRDVDGSERSAPIDFDGVQFASMAISIVEGSQGVTNMSTLANPAQREAIESPPEATGVNGVEQIVVPASNVMDMAFGDPAAGTRPEGLMLAAWREEGGENIFIEANLAMMDRCPVPDYWGGESGMDVLGGVFHKRFADSWSQTTSGATSTLKTDDGVNYAYFLAAITNHAIGYGVGLVNSTFARPSAVNNFEEEDIMNGNVNYDCTAFIAAGMRFNFTTDDLQRLQDTANGDYMNPGPNSTLPGTFRD